MAEEQTDEVTTTPTNLPGESMVTVAVEVVDEPTTSSDAPGPAKTVPDRTATTKPRTEAQRAASRANGAHSQGPVFPDGNLNRSQNALCHGFRAKTLVLSNEDADTFDALLAGYLAEHQPETITEYDLITEMAFAKWRQYRTWITETGAINKEMADTDAALTAAYEHFDESIRTAYAVESCLKRTRTLELCSRLEGRENEK